MKYFANLLFLLILSICFTSCDEDSPVIQQNPPTTPEVNIVSPKDQSSILDSVFIEINATDDKGVVKVEVYADNNIIQTFTSPPYKFTWDTKHLIDGSTHTIYAKAYDGDNNVSSSKVLLIYVYRFQPSNLKANFLSDTMIKLSWIDNSSKETGFEVEQSIDKINFTKIKNISADTISTIINGIFFTDTIYYFRVRAITDSAFSKYSNIDSIKFTVPIPSNLSFISLSENRIKLTWIDNCNYETGFKIERNENSAGYHALGEVGENITSYIDSNMAFNTNYQYRIKTRTTYNLSGYSNEIQLTLTIPVPSNLSFESLSDTKIKLKWTDNCSYETGFIIERSENNLSYMIIGEVNENITNLIDSNLNYSNDYKYRIKTVYNNYFSDYSNVLAIRAGFKFELIKRMDAHYYGVRAIDYNADGTILVSGGLDAIKIWNGIDGTFIKSISSPNDNIQSIAISPNGQLIATGNADWGLKIRRTNDGTLLKNIMLLGTVNSLKFSNDGNYLIAGSSDLRVLKTSDWQEKLRITTASAKSVDITEDNQFIASGGNDTKVHVWNINGDSINTLIGHTHGILTISFISGNNQIISGSLDRNMKVWNYLTGINEKTFTAFSQINQVDSKFNLALLAVGSASNTQINLYNLTKDKIDTLYVSVSPECIKFNPTNQSFSVGFGNTFLDMYRYYLEWK